MSGEMIPPYRWGIIERMSSIDRPRSVVTVTALLGNPGNPGAVTLRVRENDGTVSLTPDEARKLADLLRDAADEAVADRPERMFGD